MNVSCPFIVLSEDYRLRKKIDFLAMFRTTHRTVCEHIKSCCFKVFVKSHSLLIHCNPFNAKQEQRM